MDRILVVGASGQLGTAVVRKLKTQGAHLRALVRSAESASRFQSLGVETVLGDLSDPASLAVACAGVATIVATANAAIPTRPTDTFEAVERRGYRNLIEAASTASVRRFVYTSAPLSKYERLSPLLRCKRETEQLLITSGLKHVIFRADIFMDVAFTMIGSTIPLRGSENATVLRPFGFTSKHFSRIKDCIERKHVAMIPGDGSTQHAFICVDDVAAFLAAAACSSSSGIYVLGGPEALTFLDIVQLYENILGASIRVRRAPANVFRAAAMLLGPFSPAGANLMALNYIAASENTFPDSAAAKTFHVQLTSAKEFLTAKSVLPVVAV